MPRAMPVAFRFPIRAAFVLSFGVVAAATLGTATSFAAPEDRQLLFGDTHLHTSWSPDASLYGNRSADPDTAYRFAKGLPVIHPGHRARVQIKTPLDFLAVSDHAEFMGIIPMILANDPRVSTSETARRFQALRIEERATEGMGIILEQVMTGKVDPALVSKEVTGSVWHEIIDAAERHNDPGRFTTLLAWEWSSMPNLANLHRIVMLREGQEVAKQFIPHSSFGDSRPESLWAWLEETSQKTGAHFIAMPHNSNISRGLMFQTTMSNGEPIDEAYAKTRIKWEPIVEITQVKGDSETHPNLSPTDEFAAYEDIGLLTGSTEDQRADFVRSALRRGLEIERRIGTNPYQFGIAGATDSHTGLSTAEETNFLGKFARPATPEGNLAPSRNGQLRGIDLGAAGLAAVWAEENTRDAIFDAFARKETYATTGTRIGLRFFGGWDFHKRDLKAKDAAKRGYAKGVSMGGVLPAPGKRGKSGAPRFMVEAYKDPKGANLDRIQIVKGWVDARGESHERIYDLALSDDRSVDASGQAPLVGNSVDLSRGTYANSIGDRVLFALWEDPDFEPAQSAFYYVRVLEIPTPRHSLLDAIAANVPHEQGFSATIQERAYSSPIYYRP